MGVFTEFYQKHIHNILYHSFLFFLINKKSIIKNAISAQKIKPIYIPKIKRIFPIARVIIPFIAKVLQINEKPSIVNDCINATKIL